MTQTRQAMFVVLAIGLIPSTGHAQCQFQQPHRADRFVASLVPAFAPCERSRFIAGGDLQACEPVAVTEDRGWIVDSSTAEGSLTLNVIDLGDESKNGDVLISLSLRGIREGKGPADGRGMLRLSLRLTLDHPLEGDLTLPDATLEIPFDMIDGAATLETSLNTVLAELREPPGQLQGLPSCFIAEILSIDVLDEHRSDMAPVGLGWYGGRY